MTKPTMKFINPIEPKKCIGRLLKREINITDIKSSGPRIKRSIPNFDTPYLRSWWSTTFSPMFLNPAHLSREIGARPAGTEEERLAAMYITEAGQARLKAVLSIIEVNMGVSWH